MAFKNKNVQPVVRWLLEDSIEEKNWSYSAFEWIVTISGILLVGFLIMKHLILD